MFELIIHNKYTQTYIKQGTPGVYTQETSAFPLNTIIRLLLTLIMIMLIGALGANGENMNS
jgi:hypothetical protein